MAQEVATNTFSGGMIMDLQDISVPENVTTKALNATIASFNGHEGTIQNDSGNVNLNTEITEGYVPIGSVEFGGIIYIVSVNENGKAEIGTFPSPNYPEATGELQYTYSPLYVMTREENGSAVPLQTEDFGFDLQHPVTILTEPSYDGSVNLIINDGQHKPRLINSGFSVHENNTYELITRIGTNNTNRYKEDEIDSLTSLYKQNQSISKFEYNGLQTGGKLKVGNYVFYAIACDKDGNETDIICESGMIPVFLGIDGDKYSMSGGLQDQESDKCISLSVVNVDKSYNYIKFYFSRSSGAIDQSAVTTFYKIDQKFLVNNGTCKALITGYESTSTTDESAVNVQYFNVDSAKAQAINQNMLFLGNVSKENDNNYSNLLRYSLNIIPQLVITPSDNIDYYYNSKNIYNATGYHNNEFYRFGVVYIKNDNSLTQVFDVLGVNDLTETIPDSVEVSNFLSNSDLSDIQLSSNGFNNRGVCKIGNVITNITDIIGIKFNIDQETKNNLLNIGIKGCFFVRQKRIPTFIAQGYATKICETSYLPAIPMKDESGNNLYNYESFVTGSFLSGSGYGEYYPQTTGNSGNYLLRNSYLPRLFSLTDDAYCYFDKIQDIADPINEYWKYIGYIFDSYLWYDDYYRSEIYGDDNQYLVVVSTNCQGYREGTYYADFYYYMRIQPDKLLSILKMADAGFTRAHLYASNEEWNDNQGDSFDYSDSTYAYNNIYNVVKDSDGNIRNQQVYNGQYGRGWDSENKPNYDYIDDRSSEVAKCVFDRVSRLTWNKLSEYLDEDVHMDVNGDDPVFGLLGGDFYIYYGRGPVYAEKKQNEYNAKARNFFAQYRHDKTNWVAKALALSSSLGNSQINGVNYDLTRPTYNGKFEYSTNVGSSDVSRFKINPMEKDSYGIFCPEFELNQPYYNNIFTGREFKCTTAAAEDLSRNDRLYTTACTNSPSDDYQSIEIVAVSEGNTLNNINTTTASEDSYHIDNKNNHYFSAVSGTAQEVGFKFAGPEFLCYTGINEDSMNKLINDYPFNIVRGIYSAYLGAVSNQDICGKLVNIYDSKVENQEFIINNRGQNPSAYYAISDRVALSDIDSNVCYRGDCFFSNFTHRINRNFNDATSPYNDTIIDIKTFKTNFTKLFNNDYRRFDLSADSEAATNINIGDLNAVQLGSWITFPVRSSMNLVLRSEDSSNIAEKLACGRNRSFYPRTGIDASGSNKIPDSVAYNQAYSKSGGDKIYFNLEDIIYNKSYYKNRILYSNVLQSDSYTNGTRVFLSTHFKDYTDQYGSIIKLIPMSSNLLCICEHGVMLIPVNERALAGEGAGGNIYINTSNALPDNPLIVSDTYGSKWADSVILTPYGVFGVDVDSRKIWKTDGQKLEIISDFKVQSFLNKYLNPTKSEEVNVCNIKTHFNKNKNDVMFTMYDGTNCWNLCYNINQQAWITFYSWIPIISQNIGDCFISIPYGKDNYYLYKHGYSSRVPSELPKPTCWYDEQHPFEFEFIVKDKATYHKIFDNLQILSNNVPPESFHYEIVGDCFDFASDKPAIYKRQEITKKFLRNFGSSIDYSNIDMYVNQQSKSTIFPLYYYKSSTDNVMYDQYKQITPFSGYNYDALSGTEVVYDQALNEFRLCNHVKAVDVKSSILRGNMTYMEDIWKVQINPINLVQHKEEQWKGGKVPIVLNNIKVNDATQNTIDESNLEDGYTADDITIWDISRRKEVKIKDKYIKIRIRYTGDKLALISAISTLYTISYN